MSDAKQLIEHYCRNADQAAFVKFYRQQADRLWRFLCARGCSRDDAYDLLSESFLKFIQVVCDDPKSPVALLYRIAINLHIDDYRRRGISPVIQSDESINNYPVEGPETGDIREFVRSLVKTLPENEQNLLLLRYWIGLTHKEIANSLEIPEGTVRRQCAEVLKKMKKKWREETGE